MTCVVCFQKFIVSYCRTISVRPSGNRGCPPISVPFCPHLVFCVRLEKKHIDDWELRDESVLLKLLPYPGAEGRDGQRDVVHGLDLGCLEAR